MGRPTHPAKAAAIAAGLEFYTTGQPCSLGMVGVRDVKESKCFCEKHVEARKSLMQKRYQRNREHRIAKAAAWADVNAEKRKQIARDWAARNTENVKANTHKRRAGKLNATPSWFSELDDLIVREAHDLASLRKAETGISWEVDHIVPLAGRKVCGLHIGCNIQVIPRSMNRMKSNQYAV